MSTPDTMTAKVDAYLDDRRRSGFALWIEGKQLHRFARFADERHHRGSLTLKLAIQWASASRGQRAITAARRIEILRGFAKYCRQFDPDTEIPPRRLLDARTVA